MSVHSTTLAAQCLPNLDHFFPFGGINPQKMGNDWPSATCVIAKSLWPLLLNYIYFHKTYDIDELYFLFQAIVV